AIPLVVRDDAGTAPLLMQASVLTYQAYNEYGGHSPYHGHDMSGKRPHPRRVSAFNPPYQGRGTPADFWYHIPPVPPMDRAGTDVDYTTDIDVDRRPSQLLRHKALVIGGHSEYWTTRMYDAATAARNAGMNIAFFGANTVYWHTRLSPDDRTMTVYRYLNED